MKKKKFSDLVNDSMNLNSLINVKGGVNRADGCKTGICSVKINTSYCDGGAICTSGIAGVIDNPIEPIEPIGPVDPLPMI